MNGVLMRVNVNVLNVYEREGRRKGTDDRRRLFLSLRLKQVLVLFPEGPPLVSLMHNCCHTVASCLRVPLEKYFLSMFVSSVFW